MQGEGEKGNSESGQETENEATKDEDEVEVFDSSTGQWYSPEPLLQEGEIVSSAAVGNYW